MNVCGLHMVLFNDLVLAVALLNLRKTMLSFTCTYGCSVPMDHSDPRTGMDPQLTPTSNWTINVSDIRTVKVSNISLDASELDMKEFFSFSGDIRHIEMLRESETSQLAYITFKDSQGADTAFLLSGATICELPVSITPVENYELPPEACSPTSGRTHFAPDSNVRKAEDVVSSMLAKGFILGKDAINKAKDFDERHHVISNASATVASIDKKMGIMEKISMGTAVVNEKVREVDELFHVSEKTKSVLAAAEQKATTASSAIMSNPYVSTGASWVSNAFSMVARAAEDVTVMTKEKVEKAEEGKEMMYRDRGDGGLIGYTQIHFEEPSADEPPTVPIDVPSDDKLGMI